MRNAPYQFVFHRRQVNSRDIVGFMQLPAKYCCAERRSAKPRFIAFHETMCGMRTSSSATLAVPCKNGAHWRQKSGRHAPQFNATCTLKPRALGERSQAGNRGLATSDSGVQSSRSRRPSRGTLHRLVQVPISLQPHPQLRRGLQELRKLCVARRSLSTGRNHLSSWFQIAKMRRSHEASPKWQAAGLFGARPSATPMLLLSRLGGYADRSGYFSNRIENDM
jgi:hypothetical protein